MPEIVGEDEIAGERVGEGVVEVEDLNELVPFDGVQVAVGQGSDVGRRLAHRPFLPEGVTEDVTLT